MYVYFFTFFLICIFLFRHEDGFGSFTRLLLTLFVTATIALITAYIITNHPLLHTLFMGFFKNIFENPNTVYAIATIIQMIIVNTIMAYAISFLYKKIKSILLCTIPCFFMDFFR